MKKKSIKLVLKFGFSLILLFLVKESISQEKFKNDKFVIVLDVQQYWTDNTLTVNASKDMLLSINKLIEATSLGKVVYIKTIAVSKILSISFKGFSIDTVFADALDSNLTVVNNIIFEKSEGDAFSSGKLTDYLIKNNAKEIIIAGLLAEKCVYKTVLGGISRGYDIFIVPEAIGSKSDRRKQKVLLNLQKNGCKILNLQNL